MYTLAILSPIKYGIWVLKLIKQSQFFKINSIDSPVKKCANSLKNKQLKHSSSLKIIMSTI